MSEADAWPSTVSPAQTRIMAGLSPLRRSFATLANVLWAVTEMPLADSTGPPSELDTTHLKKVRSETELATLSGSTNDDRDNCENPGTSSMTM